MVFLIGVSYFHTSGNFSLKQLEFGHLGAKYDESKSVCDVEERGLGSAG